MGFTRRVVNVVGWSLCNPARPKRAKHGTSSVSRHQSHHVESTLHLQVSSVRAWALEVRSSRLQTLGQHWDNHDGGFDSSLAVDVCCPRRLIPL